MLAAASASVGALVRGPRRDATVLGVADAALYLQLGTHVLAVLTADAVRLPCGVVLPHSISLRTVAPRGPVTVGGGAIRWDGACVRVVREWAPARVDPVTQRSARVSELRAGVATLGIGRPRPGEGPGLTPSGDDVLAGRLLGARALGTVPPPLGDLSRTTALSAALLRHAAAGECVPQFAALVRGLAAPAPLDLGPLLRVGHTSGAALATGLLRALDEPAGAAA